MKKNIIVLSYQLFGVYFFYKGLRQMKKLNQTNNSILIDDNFIFYFFCKKWIRSKLNKNQIGEYNRLKKKLKKED